MKGTSVGGLVHVDRSAGKPRWQFGSILSINWLDTGHENSRDGRGGGGDCLGGRRDQARCVCVYRE